MIILQTSSRNNEGVFLIIIPLIVIIIWLFLRNKRTKKLLDNAGKSLVKLEAENALLEAEHLKFQLEPHTLKNVMANLNAISRKLHKGMDSLSNVMDYILYQGKKHFVTIENEVEFIEQYLKLNDLFIHEIDNIKFIKNLNPKSPYLNKPCVPHLVTAYFLENAFKHGSINHPQFLKIEISLFENNFTYKITNKMAQNQTKSSNSGLGLANMKKRMELFYAGKYSISTHEKNEEYTSTLSITLS